MVDDTVENLEILDEVLRENYYVKLAKNGKTALKIAESTLPDIILLDVMMPDMDGYEVCRHLKSNFITKKIPVIFVTAKNEVMDEERGFESGIVDYITKPISPSIVLARLKTQLMLHNQNRALEEMVQKRTRELVESRYEIIKRLGIAAEYKDNETGMHIYRMSNYCRIIALNYGLDMVEAELVKDVSPMHDIGKIGIPDEILTKPGKLTRGEFEIVKKHCEIGAKIIGGHDSELLHTAGVIALEHHEKWDGTGYPRGLKGEEINIYARITAIADVFDALTSKRPYKDVWPDIEAIDFIKSQSGKHFDPKVVEAFLKGINEIISIKNKYPDEKLAI